MIAPATHIWIDPAKGHIYQVIRDDGKLDRVRHVESVQKKNGETNLYRIVVVNDPDNPIRVVPPGETGA